MIRLVGCGFLVLWLIEQFTLTWWVPSARTQQFFMNQLTMVQLVGAVAFVIDSILPIKTPTIFLYLGIWCFSIIQIVVMYFVYLRVVAFIQTLTATVL